MLPPIDLSTFSTTDLGMMAESTPASQHLGSSPPCPREVRSSKTLAQVMSVELGAASAALRFKTCVHHCISTYIYINIYIYMYMYMYIFVCVCTASAPEKKRKSGKHMVTQG